MSQTAYLIDPHAAETIEVLGPTVQFLTPPDGADAAPCVMRGTIPAGGFVPLHSHADPETFIAIAGELDGLSYGEDGRHEWVQVRPGDVFHVPGGARHAWRNDSGQPAVMTIVSTARMGRFFREIAGGSPDRFAATSERYGYWNGTPDDNARIGLDLPR
jgi:quercetin dioxygenase-like cupin family protein